MRETNRSPPAAVVRASPGRLSVYSDRPKLATTAECLARRRSMFVDAVRACSGPASCRSRVPIWSPSHRISSQSPPRQEKPSSGRCAASRSTCPGQQRVLVRIVEEARDEALRRVREDLRRIRAARGRRALLLVVAAIPALRPRCSPSSTSRTRAGRRAPRRAARRR